MAGFDPADPCSVNRPVANMLAGLDGNLTGLRIGVPREYFFDVPELDAEVRQAVLDAIDGMAVEGATLVDISIPHAAIARHAQRVIMFGEAYAYHEPDLQAHPELYGKYTRQNIRQGAFFSAADYVQAQRVRSIIKAETIQALSEVDVLVTPTMLSTAPTFAGYDFESMMKQPTFTGIWNLTGSPAISICCGFSKAGLPIGMQLVGKAFDEPTMFKVGDAYQAITDWHLAVPQPGARKEMQLV
jgi:aspartyl-tRNA(Asn)/glutamyl-tRNA(Gln) amidotransferase subunit A